MKSIKLAIGIISIVLFAIISFQSCAVGIGNALTDNGETSGSSGIFLAVCMLVAGIMGICTRSYPNGGYITGIIYIFGGLVGITSFGSFSDLKIWSILCFIFAGIFLFGTIYSKESVVFEKVNPLKDIQQSDAIELQKILIENSGNDLILSNDELYQMAHDRIENDFRIIDESQNIIEKTKDIETFFMKSNLIVEKYKDVCLFEPYMPFGGGTPSEAYAQALSNREEDTKHFIYQHIAYLCETSENLPSESEKSILYMDAYETFKKRYDTISPENQARIETEFRKLLII